MKKLILLLAVTSVFTAKAQDTLLRASQLRAITTVGTDADGNAAVVALTGTKSITTDNLPTGGTWSSGWLTRGQYIGAQTVIYSNASGTYTIEYSDDSLYQTLSMPTITVPYSASQGTRVGAFSINARYVRFVYTNGAVAQTKFKFEIRFLIGAAQASFETLNAIGADSRLAQWTKSRIETKDSDTGAYRPVYATGNSLNVNVTNTIPVSIAGSINTTPSGTQQVGGSVNIGNFPANQAVTVSGTVSTTPNGTQTVSVNNFPSSQAVAVSNFPATQAVSGNVTTTPSGTQTIAGAVSVSNFPATQPVSGTVTVANPTAQDSTKTRLYHQVAVVNNPTVTVGNPVTSVGINNFPSTQTVAGTVAISNPTTSVAVNNFPASQAVTGAFYQANQPVTVSNASLPVTGTFYQATQPVSGTFWQSTQPVSATTLPLPTGASTTANDIATTGTAADTAITDQTKSGSVIALLKGLLAESVSQATSATFTAYTLTANVAQPIAASLGRKSVKITSTNGTILIGVGFVATATNYAYRIVTNATVEIMLIDAALSISLFATSGSNVNVATSN